MYLKKYEQLNQDQVSAIEHDIITDGRSFKELAQKYSVFENVINKIAADMGMDVAVDHETATSTDEEAAEAPKRRGRGKRETLLSIPGQRKHRVSLTNRQKVLIRNEYQRNKDEKGIKSRLAEKFNVSFSTITRVIDEEIDQKNDTVKEEVKKTEPEVKDISPVVPLSNYTNTKSITLRMDSTNMGSTPPLFENDLMKYKPTYDFETTIKDWFENNIKGRKVNVLEVLCKVSGNDAKIYSLLVKYCMMYKCNLVFVLPGGIKRDQIISEFGEASANLNRIITLSQDAAKYVYKTPYATIQKADTIYSLHIIYTASKSIYVTDESTKVYGLLAELCQQHEKSTFKILLYKMKDGKQEQLIELKSAEWNEK